MQELSHLVLRLERLERSNRRWKLLGLGLLAALAAGFACSSRALPEGTLTGTALELRTPEGEVYATLGLDPKGFPLFQIKKGESYALTTLQGPAIHLRSEDVYRTAFLGMDTRGTSRLELTMNSLQDGARVVVKEDGTAGFYALDPQGFDRLSMEASSNGQSAFHVYGEQRQLRGSFSVDPKGNASQLLLDTSGRRRVGFLVEPDGTPTVSLVDEDSRPRLNLSMEFDGSPKIEFLREDGRPGKRLP